MSGETVVLLNEKEGKGGDSFWEDERGKRVLSEEKKARPGRARHGREHLASTAEGKKRKVRKRGEKITVCTIEKRQPFFPHSTRGGRTPQEGERTQEVRMKGIDLGAQRKPITFPREKNRHRRQQRKGAGTLRRLGPAGLEKGKCRTFKPRRDPPSGNGTQTMEPHQKAEVLGCGSDERGDERKNIRNDLPAAAVLGETRRARKHKQMTQVPT